MVAATGRGGINGHGRHCVFADGAMDRRIYRRLVGQPQPAVSDRVLCVQVHRLQLQLCLDPDTGFWLSFFGFTFGVGLLEEFTKAMPILFMLRGNMDLDWRGAAVWGLAGGIGFGVAEGIVLRRISITELPPATSTVVGLCRALHCMQSGPPRWR